MESAPLDLNALVKVLQGGGNAALVIAGYWVYRAANVVAKRLARIEVMLEVYLKHAGKHVPQEESSDP